MTTTVSQQRSSPTPEELIQQVDVILRLNDDGTPGTLFFNKPPPDSDPILQKLLSPFQVDTDAKARVRAIALEYFDAAGRDERADRLEQALSGYKSALSLFKQCQDLRSKENQIGCLTKLGSVAEKLQRYPEALNYYEEAIQKHTELHKKRNKLDRASLHQDLGAVLQKMGCFIEAGTHFEKALSLARDECGSSPKSDLIYALKVLAIVSVELGYTKKALKHIEEGLSLLSRLATAGKSDNVTKTLQIDLLVCKRDAQSLDGQSQEALQTSQEAKDLQTSYHQGKPNREIVTTLKFEGSLLCGLKRPQEAIARFQMVLKMQEALPDKCVIDRANTLNLLGIAYHSDKNLSLALDAQTKALHLYKSFFGENTPHEYIATTLNYLVLIMCDLDRRDHALKYFVKASEMLAQLTQEGITQHPHPRHLNELYLSCKEALSSLSKEAAPVHPFSLLAMHWDYKTLSEQVKSLPESQKELLQRLTSNEPFDHEEMRVSILLFKSFGLYLRSAGYFVEAVDCFAKTLQMYRLFYKSQSNHRDIVECILESGRTLRALGRFKEVKELLEEALTMITDKKKEPGTLASLLDTLGSLEQELGEYEKASRYIDEAYEIRKALFGEIHESCILSLNNKGAFLRTIGKSQEALSCHQKALELAGPRYLTLQSIGLAELDLGNIDSALRRFSQAANLLSFHLFPRSIREIGEVLENLGHTQGFLGKYHEALKEASRVLAYYEQLFGPQHHFTARARCSVALYHDRVGEYDKALDCYTQALEIQKQVYGEKHAVVANTLEQMGSCLSKQAKYAEALKHLQKALELRISFFGDQHPAVALSLDSLALCLTYKGEYQTAESHFKRAYEIRMGRFDKAHPLLRLSESYMETCRLAITRASLTPRTLAARVGYKMTPNEFEELVHHAKSYLFSLKSASEVTLEKNPTGFVRLRLPLPPAYVSRIETLRLNFWPPELKIPVVEAPHNHPRYFESMIIEGGYRHNLFEENSPPEKSRATHVISRIFKSSVVDERTIFHVGKIDLQLKATIAVEKGAIVAFPRSLIHQVESTIEGTLSINCVLKNEQNRNHFDVFIPLQSPQDPQADREVLVSEDVTTILAKMKAILDAWTKNNPQN